MRSDSNTATLKMFTIVINVLCCDLNKRKNKIQKVLRRTDCDSISI